MGDRAATRVTIRVTTIGVKHSPRGWHAFVTRLPRISGVVGPIASRGQLLESNTHEAGVTESLRDWGAD